MSCRRGGVNQIRDRQTASLRDAVSPRLFRVKLKLHFISTGIANNDSAVSGAAVAAGLDRMIGRSRCGIAKPQAVRLVNISDRLFRFVLVFAGINERRSSTAACGLALLSVVVVAVAVSISVPSVFSVVENRRRFRLHPKACCHRGVRGRMLLAG